MLYYILVAVLFLVVIVIYYLLLSKNKNLVDVSEKINDAMGNYFILLSIYDKILKEKDEKLKKEKILDLKEKAIKYCQNYSSSIYKKDIEKMIEKLNDLEKSMQ
ncbi:MAG: hypothetical protein WH035_00920 [Spirochaetota bacterium]